ncbi:MAG: M56 family metallopeptidase, partial [Pirellulales bacterium]
MFHVRTFGFGASAIAISWLLGTAVLLVRLTFAWRRVRRLIVAAMPAETVVQETCRLAAALVGVAAPKALTGPYLASPCLVRWPRAAILLPEVTPALPLRDVLTHELAHLRRGDAGWNLLARLIEALFFYQPLVWLLSRRLEASAEEVCDDFVVQFGGDRSQYARGLLEIAELATAPVGAPAVAMVSLRSILARRVTRILDSSRSLSTRAGNLLLALVIAGGLAGATIVGFVGLAPHPSAEAEPMPNVVAKEPAATAGDKKPNASESVAKDESDQKRPEADKELRGVVIGSDGKPVAGAKLYWIRA